MDTATKKLATRSGLVTICMATWNRAEYIKGAITSVQKQSYKDWELIVVDDGSTDTTQEIIAELSAHDDRIKLVVHQQNQGIGPTRNHALREAHGEFLAVLDSDDEWLSREKLEEQVDFLRHNPRVVAVGTYASVINQSGDSMRSIQAPDVDSAIRTSILRVNPFVHSSMLMRTASVREVGGYDETFAPLEDYDLWCKLGQQGELANLPEEMTAYRSHAGNITKSRRRQAFVLSLAIVERYRNTYPGYWRALVRRKARFFVYRALQALRIVH